jgi:hypothetical protein
VRVGVTPVDPDSGFRNFTPDSGRVGDDWTFEFSELLGLQRLSVNGLPNGWAVRGVEVDGHDVADTGVEVGGAATTNVTVVVSNRMSGLNGVLRDEKLQPASGTVILFPDDPNRWREGSRLVRTARPDQEGVFDMKLVIPGDYFIATRDHVEDGEWNDPEFLKSLQEGARRVTLRDGETAKVELTLK